MSEHGVLPQPGGPAGQAGPPLFGPPPRRAPRRHQRRAHAAQHTAALRRYAHFLSASRPSRRRENGFCNRRASVES